MTINDIFYSFFNKNGIKWVFLVKITINDIFYSFFNKNEIKWVFLVKITIITRNDLFYQLNDSIKVNPLLSYILLKRLAKVTVNMTLFRKHTLSQKQCFWELLRIALF